MQPMVYNCMPTQVCDSVMHKGCHSDSVNKQSHNVQTCEWREYAV